MGKAVAVIVLLVICGVAWIVYSAAHKIAPAETDAALPSINVPDLGLKQKAGVIADKVTEGAKTAVNEISGATDTSVKSLKLDPAVIEIIPGATATVKVTRVGGGMKALKLDFAPAPGSKLVVTGGEFAQGQLETVVTVGAPGDMKSDASLTIKAGENAKLTVPVKVK